MEGTAGNDQASSSVNVAQTSQLLAHCRTLIPRRNEVYLSSARLRPEPTTSIATPARLGQQQVWPPSAPQGPGTSSSYACPSITESYSVLATTSDTQPCSARAQPLRYRRRHHPDPDRLRFDS